MRDFESLHAVYIKSGGGFWVIEDDATRAVVGMVGFEKLSEPANTGELRRMSVSDSARRAGIGRKLVRLVEEFAAENG